MFNNIYTECKKERVFIKKILLLIVVVVLSITLIGCNQKEEYKVFAVVHYESDKVVFGIEYSSRVKESEVYFYSKKKNAIQLQPEKIGNTIFNANEPWVNIKSIKSIGLKNVYYGTNIYYPPEYELINDSEIEVFKITIHKDFGFMIQIDEIYVIDVEDITAFEFVYKIDELEK